MAEEEVDSIAALADDPAFVFPVYALILTPLALYVYHDILDTRWRPVWRLVRFLLAYIILYVLSGSGLLVYIVIQIYGKDYKEVGASGLAFILGTYGAWKLTRLMRIIVAHRDLVRILQRIDCSLCHVTGLQPVGIEYHLFTRPPLLMQRNGRINWERETRHDYISSSLFDDDYPGEAAARIKWLSLTGRVRVVQDDADECASRVALWMRLVLRRPQSMPWRLLTSTSPLVQGQLYRVSLGEALRALITHGTTKRPPANVHPNPAEVLLNDGNLTEAAVGFFWIASQMGSEEMSQVLAEMPPRWMRGVSQNGKQLMFELVMSFLICDMPPAANTSVQWILSLPILEWTRDISNMRVWTEMSKICAEAVADLMPPYTQLGKMPSRDEVFETVRQSVFDLRDATSDAHGFQGDIVGLTLIELIRASYRAGYLAERILGKPLTSELNRLDVRGGTIRIYKAEIVTGLFSTLYQLGQHDSPEYESHYKELRASWGVSDDINDVFQALKERAKREMRESFNLSPTATSRYWYLGKRNTQCEDPHVAFSSVATTALEIAPLTLIMAKRYSQLRPKIVLSKEYGDPDVYREHWFSWKRSQALEVSGSNGGAGSLDINEDGSIGRTMSLSEMP